MSSFYIHDVLFFAHPIPTANKTHKKKTFFEHIIKEKFKVNCPRIVKL